MLTEPESCEAVLNDARAFVYSSPTARRKIMPQNSPRAMDSKPGHFEHPYAPRFTPGALLYAVGILLSRASKMPGRDGVFLPA